MQRSTVTIQLVGFALIVSCGVAASVMAATSSSFQQVILPAEESITFVDETDTPITTPTVPITVVPTPNAQVITVALGTPQQKLRIINPSFNSPWSVTIAATDGINALWSDGVDTYDYNDINIDGTDGPDADTAGGRLIIDPASAEVKSVINADNCPASDLSLSGKSAFQDAATVLSSITLVNGGAQHGSYCQWDLTGITLQQVIPAAQVHGGYSMEFTITII